jgi:hypothetical protein
VQPQDDLLDDDYLATLVDAAETHPGAVVVYCDIQCFGTYTAVLRQPPAAGSPMERQVELMRHHFPAVSYRGLIRARALPSLLPLVGNACDDYYADAVWIARQALVGDLVRVPLALYRKRYHAGNTHTKWFAWSAEQRLTAWLTHCVDMLSVALRAARTPADRRRLQQAARARFLDLGELAQESAAAREEAGARFDLTVATASP